MQLPKEQIAYIRQWLSIPLSNVDFIEHKTEIFAKEIEQRMQNENINFIMAFEATKNAMGGTEALLKQQDKYINRIQKEILRDILRMYGNYWKRFPFNLLSVAAFVLSYIYFFSDWLNNKDKDFLAGGYVGVFIASLLFLVLGFKDAGCFRYWNDKYRSIISLVAQSFFIVFSVAFSLVSIASIFGLKLTVLRAFLVVFVLQILHLFRLYVKKYDETESNKTFAMFLQT